VTLGPEEEDDSRLVYASQTDSHAIHYKKKVLKDSVVM
jgi:hypothetical protein